MRKKAKKIKSIITTLSFLLIICIGAYFNYNQEAPNKKTLTNSKNFYEISNIPEYTGNIYIEINNNIPMFNEQDLNIKEDYYSDLENGKVRHGND